MNENLQDRNLDRTRTTIALLNRKLNACTLGE